MSTLTRPKPPTISRWRAQERNLAYMMLLPAAFLLILFWAVPFFMAFGLSLSDQRLISPTPAQYVGLRNYTNLLSIRLLPMNRSSMIKAICPSSMPTVSYNIRVPAPC